MMRTTFSTKIVRFARELPGIFTPLVVTVIAAVLLLKTLNVVPDYWHYLIAGPQPPMPALNESLAFPSLEAAEGELQVKIATPTYFPSSLVWPPASIRGQRQPLQVVSLLFLSSDGQQALQIREIFSSGEQLPFPIPEPMVVLERRDVTVNGAAAQLLLGQGQGGGIVNQLRWQVAGLHLVVTTVYPPEELLRIAESIHPE